MSVMQEVLSSLSKYFPIILSIILFFKIKIKGEKNKLVSEILLNLISIHEMEKTGSLTKKVSEKLRKNLLKLTKNF